MPYVMVPVPEEHVEEAMGAVLRIIAKGRTVSWDRDAVNEFYGEIDESARMLLASTARSVVNGKDLSQKMAADTTQLTERELLGIMRELNDRSGQNSRPSILLNQPFTETLPNGRTRESRVFTMEPAVASWVADAERAELSAAPHPLSGLE